jgi:hypothetical protein
MYQITIKYTKVTRDWRKIENDIIYFLQLQLNSFDYFGFDFDLIFDIPKKLLTYTLTGFDLTTDTLPDGDDTTKPRFYIHTYLDAVYVDFMQRGCVLHIRHYKS